MNEYFIIAIRYLTELLGKIHRKELLTIIIAITAGFAGGAIYAKLFITHDTIKTAYVDLGDKNGSPDLTLFDKNKKERLFVGEDNESKSWLIGLSDNNGKEKLSMGANINESWIKFTNDKNREIVRLFNAGDATELQLKDKNGKLRLVIGVGDTDDPFMGFIDKYGVRRARICIGQTGTPNIDLTDEQGKQRIVLGMDAYGSPHLTLFSKDEKQRFSFSLMADGTPVSTVYDDNGKPFTLSMPSIGIQGSIIGGYTGYSSSPPEGTGPPKEGGKKEKR